MKQSVQMLGETGFTACLAAAAAVALALMLGDALWNQVRRQ